MAILHVRLQGPQTQLNLPGSIARSRITLKSYRVLFNRNNHGYYHATVTSTMLTSGNAISYTDASLPNNYIAQIPLFLDPENKLTNAQNVDMDLGAISNTSSSVTFNVAFFNCIQRKRYDQAVFDTTDPTLQQFYGVNQLQAFYGPKIPMYLVPATRLPDNQEAYVPGSYPADDTWTDTTSFDNNGSALAATGTFPTAKQWVHTGVHVGDVDPQPGQKDYDVSAVNEQERLWNANSGGAIKGSGYRKGAIIYPYAVDLVFEVSD